MTIGSFPKTLRRERGLTRREVAEALGPAAEPCAPPEEDSEAVVSLAVVFVAIAFAVRYRRVGSDEP